MVEYLGTLLSLTFKFGPCLTKFTTHLFFSSMRNIQFQLSKNTHQSFLSRDVGGYAMKGYGMGAIIIGATGAPGGAPVVCRAAGAARVAPGVMGSATVLQKWTASWGWNPFIWFLRFISVLFFGSWFFFLDLFVFALVVIVIVIMYNEYALYRYWYWMLILTLILSFLCICSFILYSVVLYVVLIRLIMNADIGMWHW